MRSAATLLESFAAAARDRPGDVAFRLGENPCRWADLWESARAFAAGAHHRGVGHGDRVVLALPNGEEFFAAFFGTQLAGGVAVPLYPRSGGERLRDIARFCEAPLVIVPVERQAQVAAFLPDAAVLTVEETSRAGAAPRLPAAAPEDLAFLQFTSGSTGDPKGVELTHRCLLTNVGQLTAGLEITDRDIFVSWLPVCHDMGLILMALVPFHLGATCVLLPSDQSGLRRWLPTLEAARGTFTAAPDFAYRLVLGWSRNSERRDLSALRVALNAAEPVRARTLADFESTFTGRPVMTPGYGLAEATVGVATGRPGAAAMVDSRGLVSVGRGLPDVRLRIADAGGTPVAAGETGEIQLRSPASTRGYFHNPSATAALFTGDGFLRTGDVGYLDSEGELFIAGRDKNLISWGGLSIAPQEIEEAVDRVAPVRRSAAVGIDRRRLEGEQVYVFAEVRSPSSELEDLAISIVEAVESRMGLRPGRVYLLRSGAIPRTANGKIRHGALRDDYLSGRLREGGGILFPSY